MNQLIKVEATKLAIGLQKILLDMQKEHGDSYYPVDEFERLIMEQKGVSKKDAELVTERVIATGIIRWEIFSNKFVL